MLTDAQAYALINDWRREWYADNDGPPPPMDLVRRVERYIASLSPNATPAWTDCEGLDMDVIYTKRPDLVRDTSHFYTNDMLSGAPMSSAGRCGGSEG
jgi:hypothetical protein